MRDIWYYIENEKQLGPISLAQLREKLSMSPNAGGIFVWGDGFPDWMRAQDVTDLQHSLVTPPPFRTAVSAHPPVETRLELTARAKDRVAEPVIAEGGWKKAGNLATSIVAGLIGLTLARTFGGSFWIPAVGVGIGFAVLNKLKTENWLVPTLAVTIGHGLWFGVAAGIFVALGRTGEELWYAGIEAALIGILVWWVLARKTKRSLYVLVAYQVFGLLMALYNFTEYGAQFALFMHVALRLGEIAGSVYALKCFRTMLGSEAPLARLTEGE